MVSQSGAFRCGIFERSSNENETASRFVVKAILIPAAAFIMRMQIVELRESLESVRECFWLRRRYRNICSKTRFIGTIMSRYQIFGISFYARIVAPLLHHVQPRYPPYLYLPCVVRFRETPVINILADFTYSYACISLTRLISVTSPEWFNTVNAISISSNSLDSPPFPPES